MVERKCPKRGTSWFSSDTFTEYWTCGKCGAKIPRPQKDDAEEKVFITDTRIFAINEVVDTLKQLRVNVVDDEYELQSKISIQLLKAGIDFQKEYYLGPRNRVDFLVNGGIAIEVKKGKPNKQQVIRQLERYTGFEDVKAIVLIVETSLYIPGEINGKRCISFGLNKLWGIAL